VLETAPNEEMAEHLGYAKHDPAGTGLGNIRNGIRPKTVLTEHSGQGRDRHAARFDFADVTAVARTTGVSP
jgi:hypothetical protein